MDCQIKQMSCYAKQLLRGASRGTVHSVYRRTINLTIEGSGKRLAALQTEESPLSPISLITGLSASDMEALPIKKGDAVKFSGGCLEIDSFGKTCRFFYSDAKKCDLKLPGPVSAAARTKLSANIACALSQAETGGFEMIFNSKTNSRTPIHLLAAETRIRHSTHLYREGRPLEAASELLRLLGLGAGLTPSGDDFLCGVLAGLRLAGLEHGQFATALKEGIAGHLSDTVDVSAAFLSCALENQYSLAVGGLYHLPAPGEISCAFSAIGHSSGMDTLCGVWHALNLDNPPE